MAEDQIGGFFCLAYAAFWAWTTWTGLSEGQIGFRGKIIARKRNAGMFWAIIGLGVLMVAGALFVATLAFLDARKQR
jgi:hypothetical protein